jgi:Protein of unknown function (DUF3822)
MSNRNYQYLDPDFSPEKTKKYTLLVKADNTAFSFAVTDKNKLLVLTEGHNINELNGPTDENDFLFKSYKQSIIGLSGNAFTFVPVSLFDPEKVADFARFLDVKATEKVFSLPFDADNQVIFKAGEPLLSAIADKFDLKDVVFAPKGWATTVAGNGPSNNDLFLNITDETVEILNFKGDKLRFYNTFEFQNEDELVYFTSFVAGELQLAPESISLILSGEIELDDKNYNRLGEFFNKVELNGTGIVNMPAQFSPHSSLALTALTLCGSSGVH